MTPLGSNNVANSEDAGEKDLEDHASGAAVDIGYWRQQRDIIKVIHRKINEHRTTLFRDLIIFFWEDYLFSLAC